MSITTIIADGSTRLFAYPFAIFSEKELEIRVDGAVVTEGVTITGEGASDGGHVTFVNPPLAGAVVTLHRLGKVEVSGHDIPGFLEDKLVAGDNVAITRQTVAGRETLVVSATFDGDDYLRKDQNLADLPDAAAARDNLGLGSAAVLDAGTDAGDLVRLDAEGRLPAVDGSRLTDIPFGRVKVSDTDTVADFLAAKLVAGDGISLTPQIDAGGQSLVVARSSDSSETWIDLGSGTSLVLDGAAGPNLVFTMIGTTSISAVNLMAGRIHTFMIRLHQDSAGGHDFTLPASTKWPYGEVPLWPTGAEQYALFTLSTWDQGATWLASFIGAEYA